MGMTLASAINTARTILNDPDAVRYPDADLVEYGNAAITLISGLRPHLFSSVAAVTCVGGSLQSVAEDTAQSVVDVLYRADGAAITPVARDALDQFQPEWRGMTAGPAVHWMPVTGDPLKFELYPPSTVGQTIDVLAVRIPDVFAAGDDTGLPSTLSDPIADYIVHRCESRDDEHVNSNRAAQFLASFVQKIRG